jgi:hypothetical protein
VAPFLAVGTAFVTFEHFLRRNYRSCATILKIVYQMSQPLSEEVLQRIAENKAKALAKLAAKRKHDESTQTSDSTDTQKTSNDEEPKVAKRRARWAKPIFEYDLSQMVDTRGGFLVDDEANDDENNQIETKKNVVDINPRKYIRAASPRQPVTNSV